MVPLISDASGNYIPGSRLHYTKEVKMWISNHVNKMRFELAEVQDTKINGYLLRLSLKDHNPDIDWAKGILTWRSEYCKARCLGTWRRLQFITEEELLAEDAGSVYLLGMAKFTDEDGKDIAIKL